jgi:hypothetical protein
VKMLRDGDDRLAHHMRFATRGLAISIIIS